jgi:hypothetical protein
MPQETGQFQIKDRIQMPTTQNDSAQALKSARVELKEIADYPVPEPTIYKEILERPAEQPLIVDSTLISASKRNAEIQSLRDNINAIRKKAGLQPIYAEPPPKAVQPTLTGRLAGFDVPRSSLWKVWDSSTEFARSDVESAIDNDDCEDTKDNLVDDKDDHEDIYDALVGDEDDYDGPWDACVGNEIQDFFRSSNMKNVLETLTVR